MMCSIAVAVFLVTLVGLFIIGKMKDEFCGFIVIEFVGLNSKMYSMEKTDGKECNTASECHN